MTILGWTLVPTWELRELRINYMDLERQFLEMRAERDRLKLRIKAIRAEARKQKARALKPRILPKQEPEETT